jgi:isopenicillin-N epimerase
MKYGKSILNLWNLNPEITFLNNGSFGATPKSILAKQREYQDLMEKNPVEFVIDIATPMINEANLALAKLVNCKPENITFVENATTAVNSALNFLLFQNKIEGEILYSNQTYPAVINTLKYYEQNCNVKLKCVNIPYPADNSTIINEFKDAITPNTKIAVIDTISSATGMIFPYNELSKLFKNNNIITIVDGAHAVGCIDVDLSNPDFDFFTSNNHKWLFAPKGSASLWTSDRFINDIHPLAISLFYRLGYRREFEWQGTKDLTTWIATKDAIDFYYEMGGKEILEYNNKTIRDAKKLILSEIDTYSIDNDMNCSLSTFFFSDKIEITPDISMRLRKYFIQNYKIEIPFMIFDNKIWFRITAQIYNEFNDYQILVDALKDFSVFGINEFLK